MSTTPSVASEGRTSVAATKAEELQARAKALREEVKELEASAAGTRRPKEVVEAQQVSFLLDVQTRTFEINALFNNKVLK